MHRRRCLALLGGTFAVGLAGCSGNGSSDTDSVPSIEDPTDDEEVESTYRQLLLDRGIDVVHVDMLDDRLVMDYETETTTEEELLEEMEIPVFAYADIVGTEWTVGFAEIWIIDPEIDDPREAALASYLVETEWALEWQNNELSDTELMERTTESFEAYEAFQNRFGGN